MRLRYRQQVTAAGVSVVALALTLGATVLGDLVAKKGERRQRGCVLRVEP